MSATLDEILRLRLARGVRLQEDKARSGFVLLAPERVLAANPTAVAVFTGNARNTDPVSEYSPAASSVNALAAPSAAHADGFVYRARRL
jgi:hypothetical protein